MGRMDKEAGKSWTLEELRGEFERSNSLINAADLAPSSKTTYLVHADRFVRMACRGS